jgi:DNA-binding CsgD family transcriptional regulator
MAGVSPRGIGAAIRACYATREGETWPDLRDRVMSQLRLTVPIDAAFVATADPETLLFSSGWQDEPLRPWGSAFLDAEFASAPDVNRFADLVRSARTASTLDEATAGDRSVSPRWRTILAPMGLGDELRVVLHTSTATWGYLCLHREGASSFSRAEVTALEQLAPHAAEAIRRTMPVLALAAPHDGGLLLCDQDVLVSWSEGGAEMLDRLDGRAVVGDPVPLVLRSVIRRLEAIERDPDGAGPLAAGLLVTRDGSVVAVHASRLTGRDGDGCVALSLAPAAGPSFLGLRLASLGLTPAQVRVARSVLRGQSTREIMHELHISQHTVQDHMKAIFDRTGVRSRRELVATLMR